MHPLVCNVASILNDGRSKGETGLLSRRKFLWGSGTFVAGTLGLGFYACGIEPHWLEITRRILPIADLPDGLVGASVAQLSDLHVGPRVDDDYLISTLKRVDALKPDIVAYTGDFVTYGEPPYLDQLSRVIRHTPRGRLATLAILGNHDYGRGWRHREIGEAIVKRVAAVGISVLRNQRYTVSGLQIIGLDDLWGPCFGPSMIMSEVKRGQPSMVLCHNPDVADLPVWGEYAGWILSGHTHGGQCRPPFLPPPILPVQNRRYTAGAFDLADGRQMYISRGVGTLLPVRFNVRPEVAFFTLSRA